MRLVCFSLGVKLFL